MGKGERNKNQISEEKDLLKVNSKKNNKPKREFPVFTVFCLVVGILLAAFITYNIMTNSGFFLRQKTVIQVGDTKVNAMEFEHSYQMTLNQYSQLLQYAGVTSSTDLSKTQCTFDTSKTWAEYLVQAALGNMTNTLYLYNEAVESGVKLDDEKKKDLDDALTTIEQTCKENNISKSTYFSKMYRQGFTEKDFKRMAEMTLLAEMQQQIKADSFTYTDEQKETYYNENKSSFDKYTYRLQEFKYTAPVDDPETEEDESKDETAKNEAKAKAEEFLNLVKDKDENNFKTEAYNTLTDEQKETNKDKDTTLISSVTFASITQGTNVSDWLKSNDRKAGDTAMLEGTNTFYVIYFVSAARDEYNAVTVRNISVTAEEVEDSASDEEKQQAKDKAKTKVEEALAKFEESDKSEDSFKNIVGNYSDDTATIENGGLYEHLGKDVYSDKVDEWVFSSERKAGDYSMIESDGDYNIVYIVSIDNPYWSYTVENAMKNNDWTKYLETLQEKYKDKITLDSNAANEII